MKRTIIAISRSYGSGGTLIGQKLAAELGIPMFNKQIIEMAAQKSGLSPDYIDRMEDHASNSFLFNLASTAYPVTSLTAQYDVPITFAAFSAQSTVIRELASRDSCVIIGRCADYILRDNADCVKVFIYADKSDCIAYTMKAYNMEQKAATSKLAKIDKGRANYYKNFTGEAWGSVHSHDLCFNSSRTGYDGAVEVIKGYLKAVGRL